MNDELVFYTNPRSRGRIVRWMLEEVGAPYRTEIIEYGDAMRTAEYLAVNPMGKVPALTHDGRAITECAAICAYLADAFPSAGLAPALADRARYYRWLFFCAGPLETALLFKGLGVTLPQEKEAMAGYGNLTRTQDTLESALADSDYIAGDTFTAADVYVGSQIAWGLQFNTLEKRDSFADYAARVTAREAYQRANELDGPM